MTIRSKLTLLYSGLLAVFIIVFGVMVFTVNRWVLVSSVDATLAKTADRVWHGSDVTEVEQFGQPSRIVVTFPEDLDIFAASGVVVQVWRVDGQEPERLRASSDLDAYATSLDLNALQAAAADRLTTNGDTSFYNTVRLEGGDWRTLTLPYEVMGWHIVIQAATSFEAVNAASNGLLAIMLITTGSALIGSMVIGTILTDRVLQPIGDITRSAAQITTAKDLKRRLDWAGPPDELGQLVSVFNGTMERLEHLFSVQQRFVADVSHELRTPLTAIRGHFELIRRYGMDPESVEAIHSEIGRMSRLVTDLLLLARADYGGLQLNKAPVDLDIIVEEVVRESRLLSEGRALQIKVREFQPVRVEGDADRLKQLLLNLMTNAIKFTPDNGHITIDLTRHARHAQVAISDTGVGIAPDHLKHIFNRFYQADESRARQHSESGVGLGLSIAQWIAEAHGGQITVTSAVDHGSTFTLSLPHAEPVAKSDAHSAVTRPRLPILRRNQSHSDGVPTVKP